MKILIIGLGGIGQRHTRNLRALLGDSVEIIAYRVRRLTHVVTPTMGADAERNVEDMMLVLADCLLEPVQHALGDDLMREQLRMYTES